jgi:hypothetical protein
MTQLFYYATSTKFHFLVKATYDRIYLKVLQEILMCVIYFKFYEALVDLIQVHVNPGLLCIF